jgi:hypothetical protein
MNAWMRINDGFELSRLRGAELRDLISIVAITTICLITGCGPSEQQKELADNERRAYCPDSFCSGDVPPQPSPSEAVIKLNGEWFVGPREYFSQGIGGASFEWWDHRLISRSIKRPQEMQALAEAGRGDEFSIKIFLRSNNFPPEPTGYKLIELAQSQGWIAQRKTLRPGLDAIDMKHVVGPSGQYIDQVTYYVATKLKGADGLPPVAACDTTHPEGMGGTGFMWRPGIWAGTRMNQKHCTDWPEIYIETVRVLQLLRKE